MEVINKNRGMSVKKSDSMHYLRKPGIQIQDILLMLLFVLLFFFLRRFQTPINEAFLPQSELSYVYIAKQQGSHIYAIDEGHNRLICFDRDGNELFERRDISDNGQSILYIDDMAVSGNTVYLSASEWDGMQVARELILSMDQDGNYLETFAERDYSSRFINKHRFYGMSAQNGVLTYAECLENSILIHRIEIGSRSEKIESMACMNAFNAVSDIAFDENDIPVVLSKNGEIRRYNSDTDPALLYSTKWEGEEQRVPFRLGIYDGQIFFTDIRNHSVVRADMASRCGTAIYKGTDSQTITFTPEGRMLLCEAEGIRMTGREETVYSQIRKTSEQMTVQGLQIVLSGILGLLSVIILIRIIVLGISHKYTITQGVGFSIIASMILVTGIISAMLMFAFRTNYREKIKEQLEAAAYVVASQISEEDINQIRIASDFDGDAYRSVISLMEHCIPVEQPFYSQIYCNIMRLDQSGTGAYAVAYLDQSIGVYFPLDEYERESIQKVYDTREKVWNDASSDVTGTYMEVKVPIIGSFNEVVGVTAVGADTWVIDDTLDSMQKRVVLSVAVIAMLIWVLTAEIMSYVLTKDSREGSLSEGRQAFPAHLVRLLVFLIFSAYNLSSTFLPVYVLRNSGLFSGAMKNLAASLPLTVNIFALGIMSLFCAGLVRKMGMKKIMAMGSVTALAGNLILLLIPNYFAIFLGLLLDGIGEGLIMNAIYVMLTYLRDEEDRRSGFSIYNAASLSGINFGMLAGSLLAVTFGQRPVFLASVLTWLGLLVLGLLLMKHIEGLIAVREENREWKHASAEAFAFVSDKAVLSFIALIQNPYIVFNSFIFYLVPVFCDEHGYNETIVSILIMLYTQIAVITGDFLTERLSSVLGERAMYAALLTNVAAVLFFVLTGTMEGLVIALILLGLSAAYGKPVQQTYLLQQDAAVRYGEDRAIGVSNFSENIGESLGPIIFSRLTGAALHGYAVFLGVITGCCGLHFVINAGDAKHKKASTGRTKT